MLRSFLCISRSIQTAFLPFLSFIIGSSKLSRLIINPLLVRSVYQDRNELSDNPVNWRSYVAHAKHISTLDHDKTLQNHRVPKPNLLRLNTQPNLAYNGLVYLLDRSLFYLS